MADKYLIDANVFITAHRQFYPFDVVPSFWEQLVERASEKILIIKQVQDELLKGRDILTEWYKVECSKFTVLNIPDNGVIEAYSKIINSINENQRYKQTAKDEFASIADSWLCAYGLALNIPIVTLETFQADTRKKIKIPNVCEEFGIKYINLIQFMREVNIRL